MGKLVLKLLAASGGFFIASELITGFNVLDLKTAIIAALLLSVLNVFLKPILKIISFPITIMTLGLFLFVINGVLIYVIGDIIDGVEVLSFMDAIMASVIISLCGMAANAVTAKE